MSAARKLCTLTACLALGVMSVVSPAEAARAQRTIVVHPGHSIQAAVDRARPGDTVVVTAGTYHQGVVVQKNRLTLRTRGHVTLRPGRAAGLCDFEGEKVGICVLPADVDLQTGTYSHRVRHVTIKGFHVRNFRGDGVLGYGTSSLHVKRVRAANNEEYGIVSFDGRHTVIQRSTASGADEAGIYVGDSRHADAVVKHNRAWNNGFGIFVRHTHGVRVRNNRVRHNCVGVLLLDDGQRGGSGDNRVARNIARRNNKVCPASEEGPRVSGGGILLIGSQRNLIVRNRVFGNHSPGTLASGGIVLREGANHNVVRGNRLRNNRPADIIKDRSSVANRFINNHCSRSRPAWICAG